MVYQLTIHKIEQSCLFELTWGQGQRIAASLPYPAPLTTLYQAWRRAYISYYQRALRGRVAAKGQIITQNTDWHSQVVQAEARLLSEFHKWLRHEALFDLRAELVRREPLQPPKNTPSQLAKQSLFLSCSCLEIARLPWETWEIGADLRQGEHIRIVRAPSTIRSTASTTAERRPMRRGKTRVLAILGDERGLDFKGDRAALNAQKKLLDIHYVGWQPNEDVLNLKTRICQAIADPLGWDVLFFAGHSNEAALVDGQVAIAPHTAIAMRELMPYLRQAKQQGLQFAIFNSCSGLDIASGLIDLGLSQVAIMREPIHNDVAQAFLVQFLQRLASFEDAEEALVETCRFLKLAKNLTYPSAYLVPSLFRHPESVPYRIQPTGWQYQLQRWRLGWYEVAAVSILALVSLLPMVRSGLLDQRLLAQAIYRNWTGQVTAPEPTRVLIVQIDTETLRKQRILGDANPIDRALLSDLIATLVEQKAQVIGIDYLLDSHDPVGNPILNQTLQQAVDQRSAWFIFAGIWDNQGQWQTVLPEIASPNWSLEGNANVPHWHLLPRRPFSSRPAPFSYQIAVAHTLTQAQSDSAIPRPHRQSQTSLHHQLEQYFDPSRDHAPQLPSRAYLHPLTNFSYLFHQRWLQPLIDFSLPPHQTYQRVPAWQLLEAPASTLQALGDINLENWVVLIAAGGYEEAGLAGSGGDIAEPPPAFDYWQRQMTGTSRQLTLGESHGYMVHHLLTPWLVLPLPALSFILLAGLVGKALSLCLVVITPDRKLWWIGGLAVGTLGYGWLSLQLYISGAVMLPWLLPSLTVWCFVGPILWKKHL
ncbi:MAG: CHASE2 domain-containing protein [Cyanobacteria bacterium J06639_14]